MFAAMVFSPNLVMLINTGMKIIKSAQQITPFGGLNFAMEELDKKGVGNLLNNYLPKLPNQSHYSWKDIVYSFWSIPLCGGDCIEDLNINLKHYINNNPFFRVPSADSILRRLKNLSRPSKTLASKYSQKKHQFSIHMALNKLNIKLIKMLGGINSKSVVLDYDNTIIKTKKADAKRTYLKEKGYNPGVGIIGDKVVYVENKNGNSDAQSFQERTLKRMFKLLNIEGIKINVFRADSASYTYPVIEIVKKYVDYFFIRARNDQSVTNAIASIDNWEEVTLNEEQVLIGSTTYRPFHRARCQRVKKHPLSDYRLVVIKVPRRDGQLNVFTNEAYLYRSIITNDYEMSNIEVFQFYNQRGGEEREFDVLKNDFCWNNIPFSNLNENTVFLILTAMARNIYSYLIRLFSQGSKLLKSNFRIKKFIFRFIIMPAKWTRRSRQNTLNVYNSLPDK
jgi:hypothetical protein